MGQINSIDFIGYIFIEVFAFINSNLIFYKVDPLGSRSSCGHLLLLSMN